MRIRPDILDILELASGILRDEFSENSYDERRYETFMIANAITIAARQLEIGATPERTELRALLSLMDISYSEKSVSDQDLPILFSNICQNIRKGKFDPGSAKHEALRRILSDSAYQLVREYSPKYLGDELK